MGKRGPKKGQGGRPHGGNHSEAQRQEWRLRKIEAARKKAEREKKDAQLKDFSKIATLKPEDRFGGAGHTVTGDAFFSYLGKKIEKVSLEEKENDENKPKPE